LQDLSLAAGGGGVCWSSSEAFLRARGEFLHSRGVWGDRQRDRWAGHRRRRPGAIRGADAGRWVNRRESETGDGNETARSRWSSGNWFATRRG
jgi:hypothetical protein